MTTPAAFFEGDLDARGLFEAIRAQVDSLGGADVRVTRSQIAFRSPRPFAWVWRPAKYLKGQRPPLVLTVSLQRRDASPRWKEIVEPAPGRFTHHLELYSADDIDDEVRGWLKEARTAASTRRAS